VERSWRGAERNGDNFQLGRHSPPINGGGGDTKCRYFLFFQEKDRRGKRGGGGKRDEGRPNRGSSEQQKTGKVCRKKERVEPRAGNEGRSARGQKTVGNRSCAGKKKSLS